MSHIDLIKSYKLKPKNKYIEYENGTCTITCTCGNIGPVVTSEFLDLSSEDSDVRKYLICPKCKKPLLSDLPLNVVFLTGLGDIFATE